jgi:hypothetical protein
MAANLAEKWKKRKYEKAFVNKIIDCAGEAAELEIWWCLNLVRSGLLATPSLRDVLTETLSVSGGSAFHLPASIDQMRQAGNPA